jgi:hypothetical protein
VYDSGRLESFRTCFAANEAKLVAVPPVQVDPADMSLAASVIVTAAAAMPGKAA